MDNKTQIQYVSAKEVAQMLSLSLRTIRRLQCGGLIPYYKIGTRSVRFDPVEVQEILFNRKNAGGIH